MTDKRVMQSITATFVSIINFVDKVDQWSESVTGSSQARTIRDARRQDDLFSVPRIETFVSEYQVFFVDGGMGRYNEREFLLLEQEIGGVVQ